MQNKDRFSLSTTNNKTDSDKKNLSIAELLAEIMPLQKFVLSKVCLYIEGSRKQRHYQVGSTFLWEKLTLQILQMMWLMNAC